MTLTTIILTYNEERHISRAIKSVQAISEHVIVVDSGSTDATRRIALDLGARVLEHTWINYATQFNWALEQLPPDTDWVLRLDADEIVTPDLVKQLRAALATAGTSVAGIYVSRRISFLGRSIRHGGVFPIRVLRLFRYGQGRCENRWMDEHLHVDGPTLEVSGEIVDDNLNSLTWWTEKHNSYASREVVDLLNLEHGFLPFESVADLRSGKQAGVKRWLKEKIYARLPGGFRAFAYFVYRYILRLGFLDGQEGRAFHFLQGFWYRYLVDAKLAEVKSYMRKTGAEPRQAIEAILGIRL
jgi:glycosyltransferase involved in cell wall biosynthesis